MGRVRGRASRELGFPLPPRCASPGPQDSPGLLLVHYRAGWRHPHCLSLEPCWGSPGAFQPLCTTVKMTPQSVHRVMIYEAPLVSQLQWRLKKCIC